MPSKNVKKRNWAFVAYPESLPENWLDKLEQTGLQCAISPLHDQDINPDGEPKKPHYHVIICYSGPTSFSVVKGLTDSLNCPIPVPLEQVRGYYRYLTHKDNPEKAQYKEADIKSVNGFNIMDFSEFSKSEILAIKKELQLLINEENIIEYSDFLDLVLCMDRAELYDVASSNTLLFEKYITSRRHRQRGVKSETDKQRR